MQPADAPPPADPLLGNSISGLLDCALDLTTQPVDISVIPENWEPPTPAHIAVLLPQYQIELLIGRGGMGAVYKGRQITLQRPVAIKVLPAELARNTEFVARFHREAQLLASLSHQGIVTIFDFGQTTEGHLYFVMEFVDGTDLYRLIHKAPQPLDAKQALSLTMQICEAMQYAHDMGVVHRDIKPANVLVTRDGRAKLADFGLAMRPADPNSVPEPPKPEVYFDPQHSPNAADMRFTAPGAAMGTPDYAAPEVYEGKADERSDIYALGIMLYEMLTGAPPKGYFQLPSTMAKVDHRVDQVVVKALEIDPAARYQKASEMGVAVEAATKPLAKQAPPPPKRTQVQQPPPQSRRLPPPPAQVPQRPRPGGWFGKLVWLVVVVAGISTSYDAGQQWTMTKRLLSLMHSSPSNGAPPIIAKATQPPPLPQPQSPPPKAIQPSLPASPTTSPSTIADPAFEKDLRAYSWLIPSRNWVIEFKDNHEAKVDEGDGVRTWHWWIVGPRTLHIQFSVQPATFDASIGGTYIFDSAMMGFQGANGNPLGVRHKSLSTPASSAVGNTVVETDFTPLLDRDHQGGWKYVGSGEVKNDNGIFSVWHPRPHSTDVGMYWYATRTYADFVLRLEFMTTDGGVNSGVFLRIPALRDGPQTLWFDGSYEIEIKGQDTGFILPGKANLGLTLPFKANTWNEYEITAQGQDYSVKLNGVLINKFTGNRNASGYIAIQSFTDTINAFRFRNVRIKELGPAKADSSDSLGQSLATLDKQFRAACDKEAGKVPSQRLYETYLAELHKLALTVSNPSRVHDQSRAVAAKAGFRIPIFGDAQPRWRTRCIDVERMAATLANGGSHETEVSIKRALFFLKGKQNADGSWGNTEKAGRTGLALLAFIGHCETFESADYGDTTLRAALYLIEVGKKNDEGILAADLGNPHAAEEHGMSTTALAELYEQARLGTKSIPGLREAFEKAIKGIIKHQRLDGGWAGMDRGQGFRPIGPEASAIFASAWQIQALAAAKRTGLKIPFLQEALTRSDAFIRSKQDKDGGFGIARSNPDTDSMTLTGAGMNSLQLVRADPTTLNNAGRFTAGRVLNSSTQWNTADLHGWLFYAQALIITGGENWRAWNLRTLPLLLGNQKADGSFPRPSTLFVGDENDSTALAALILEAFYRVPH